MDDEVTARKPKSVYHLADDVEMSGIEVELGFTQNVKSTKSCYCRPSHVRHGQCTSPMLKDRLNHFHLSCPRKILQIRWQDIIPDIEVLEKAEMQSVYTHLKLSQRRWTDMSQECLMCGYQRRSSMENFKWESVPKVAKTNAIKTP